MSSYAEVTGRVPDFRVEYEWVEQSQKLFQHMRSDFAYREELGEAAWMIWPEFEDENQMPLPERTEIPNNGTATMWIMNRDEDLRQSHRLRLRVGLLAFMVTGSKIIANLKVIDLLGILHNSKMHSKDAPAT